MTASLSISENSEGNLTAKGPLHSISTHTEEQIITPIQTCNSNSLRQKQIKHRKQERQPSQEWCRRPLTEAVDLWKLKTRQGYLVTPWQEAETKRLHTQLRCCCPWESKISGLSFLQPFFSLIQLRSSHKGLLFDLEKMTPKCES